MLHIKVLPDFEGKLTQSSVELLVSYLTAPYLRIPLILNFFATPEHIHALGVERLQTVIDGALFEPGLWQSATTEKAVPTQVPTTDRALFATPCGLLFNELQKSPHGLMRALSDLLEFAIELDTGKYSPGTASIILYVIRVIVRVEAFMLFLIQHHRHRHAAASGAMRVAGCGERSLVRGLECTSRHINLLSTKRAQIRQTLNEQVHPMLERWCEVATRADDIATACICHAHLAFVFANLPYAELTRTSVSTLVASQVMLTTSYRFDLSAENGASAINRMTAHKELAVRECGLGIVDTDMFDLFTSKRNDLLTWLNQSQDDRNSVLETVVQTVTLQGERHRGAQADPLESTHSDKNNNNKENQPSTASSLIGKPLQSKDAAPQQTRYWRQMDGRHCVGRFIPDVAPRTQAEQNMAEQQRMLSRGEQRIDTEVNLQLGSLTLNQSRLEVLDARIVALPDFSQLITMQCPIAGEAIQSLLLLALFADTLCPQIITFFSSFCFVAVEVFGDTHNQMQCAPVKLTTQRQHLRLVGTRHDVLAWRPDSRTPPLANFTRTYSPDSLNAAESWIGTALERVRTAHAPHSLLANCDKILLPDVRYDANSTFALLRYHQVDRPPKPASKSEIVLRDAPVWIDSPHCTQCLAQYTVSLRQHHCRNWSVFDSFKFSFSHRWLCVLLQNHSLTLFCLCL